MKKLRFETNIFKTAFLPLQTLLFIAAGLINTAINFAVYSVCILFLSMDYRMAALLGLLVSIVSGFLQSRHGIFRSGNGSSLARYLLLWGGLYLLTITLIGWLVQLEIGEIIAYLLSVLIIVPISFLAQKYWVFH